MASLSKNGSGSIIATVEKVAGLDEVRNYLYDKLIPDEKDRFYNKLTPTKIFNDLSSCKLKVKEIPGMERNSVVLSGGDGSVGTIEERMISYSPGRAQTPTRPDFISDLAYYAKNCTLVLEGPDTYREFKFTGTNSDMTLLTANDKEFIRDAARSGITMLNTNTLNVNLVKNFYIAESSAKPDWVKLNIGIGDFVYPIMFSKVIIPEENKKYPLLNIYNYQMMLDPEWYDRLKTSSKLTKENIDMLASSLKHALDTYTVGSDIPTHDFKYTTFTFSYNGVNVFDSYNETSNGLIFTGLGIKESAVPFLRSILATLVAKGHNV